MLEPGPRPRQRAEVGLPSLQPRKQTQQCSQTVAGCSPLTFFWRHGQKFTKTIDNLLESRRAEQRAKLPLATLAELWREGGMQSLGHRSTSLFFFFPLASFPSSQKCSLASTSCVTNAKGWRAGCVVPFLGTSRGAKSKQQSWTQDRELWNNKKKVEGFLHCRPPPSFSTAGWLLSLS